MVISSLLTVLSCLTGGFPSTRRSEVRDITVSLLSELYHGVSVKPHLQPLTGELLSHHSANKEDNAGLDVAVHGFLGGTFRAIAGGPACLSMAGQVFRKLTFLKLPNRENWALFFDQEMQSIN